MTNLKLKSPERESILDNYERIMTEGINSSCNTSYNDLRVVSTVSNVKNPGNDVFLEDALERAQRKIQTDKTRAPPQTIYTEVSLFFIGGLIPPKHSDFTSYHFRSHSTN